MLCTVYVPSDHTQDTRYISPPDEAHNYCDVRSIVRTKLSNTVCVSAVANADGDDDVRGLDVYCHFVMGTYSWARSSKKLCPGRQSDEEPVWADFSLCTASK
eukprot:scpid78270/ scgid24440/ 